jgi:uncharacterized protein (TIGR03382 family)
MRVPALLGLLPLLAATAAWPCSIALEFTGPFEPTQAAERVPLNAGVWLAGGFNANGAVRIEGEELPMQGERGVQVVRPELAPGELTFTIFSTEMDRELPPVAVVVADELDETPPVFADALAQVDVELHRDTANSCLPGSPGRFVTVMPPRADDDFGVAGYTFVRRVDGEVVRTATSVGRDPQPLRIFIRDDDPEGELELVAFDLAGLASAPRSISLEVAGRPVSGGGCSSAGAGAGPLAAFALLLLARRRRR